MDLAADLVSDDEPSAATEVLGRTCSSFISNLLLGSKSASLPQGRGPSEGLTNQLTLKPEIIASLLLVMEPDRVKRLVAMPLLLLLPAMEFGVSPSSKLLFTPSLMGDFPPVDAPEAESISGLLGPSQSDGRPPLPPNFSSRSRAGQGQLSENSKKSSSTNSLDSMALYSMAVFLSQTWRSLTSHSASATITMEASSTCASGSQAAVSPGAHLQHLPRVVVTRPAVSTALRDLVSSGSSSSGSSGKMVSGIKHSSKAEVLRVVKDMAEATKGLYEGLVGQVLQNLALLLVR